MSYSKELLKIGSFIGAYACLTLLISFSIPKLIQINNDKADKLIALPGIELSKIEILGGSFEGNDISILVMNKSSWVLKEIKFAIEIFQLRQGQGVHLEDFKSKKTLYDMEALDVSRKDSTLLVKRFFSAKSIAVLDGAPFSPIAYSGKLPKLDPEQWYHPSIASAKGFKYSGEH